ncbi:MAG: hypothetical protein KGL39_12605 [Patescibacteria group bacterium]|nr:hypothetical protein [Patescibacteria group bacterium]
MPIRANNQRNFHRKLFAGQTETITLKKRGDDQNEGTITDYLLFTCRRSLFTKTGEQIALDETANTRCVWHIPKVELDRVGISWLNSLDRIVDGKNRWWQPEATTTITVKLFSQHVDLECLRVDPPNNVVTGL